MQQFCRRVGSSNYVSAWFSEAPLARALAEASCVLVQVYWRGSSRAARRDVCAAIRRRAPGAVLVGASSSGGIVEGALLSEGIVVSVSCFQGSRARLLLLEDVGGREFESGRSLALWLASCDDLRGALVLAMPAAVDQAAILLGLREAGPSLLVFGGGASPDPGGDSGVLCGDEPSERALAAVALCGPELEVETLALFGWRPLGPSLVITEAEGYLIREIDGRPAFDLYREYLGVEDRDDLESLEFPLLVKRDGDLVARNPLSADEEGCILVSPDVEAGESARLGYFDVRAQARSVELAVASLRDFGPEAVFLYSCVCRLLTLREGVESEIRPFQALAPASGFFTLGEYYRSGGKPQLLGSTELVIALREGPAPRAAARAPEPPQRPADPLAERHARLTSHLFRFIGALTERVEAANEELSVRNRELAASNERLCAEVQERKLAEEHARSIAAEREMLLRELQHRVKNSMALISSIASIEARQNAAPEAKAALAKLVSRIAALASLYDILFVSGDIEEIGLAEYLGEVVDFAAKGHGADAAGVAIASRIERVRLDVKRAVPIGLIVNELVIDAMKYAFPGGRGGRIEVSLVREGRELALKVEDDGVGLPQGADAVSLSGFGLTLVRSLAAQLGAGFSIRSEGGARFELRLPLDSP